MGQKGYPPASLAWLVWGLGALFYFTAFYHRVAPAVMTDRLMAEFYIGAAALGNFTAFYFYSYFLMQIPTGILADHWGPRKLLAAASLVAACGTFLFASASSIVPANLGRLLVGGASGVAFVSLLRLSVCWFPARVYATQSGLALLVGVSGAVSAGVPLHLLVEQFGWRPVMFTAAALHLLLGAIIWTVIRDNPAQRGYRSHAPADPETTLSPKAIFEGLATVLRYKNTWLLAIVSCGLTGPVIAFAGLWGVPFFTTHYGMTTATSSALTSTLLICYALGGILFSFWSDRIGRRKPVLIFGTSLALAAWIPVLFVPMLPIGLLIAFVVATGLASGSVIVCFAFVKETVPPRLAGTVSGVCNMGSMIGPILLQPALGWMLDSHWQGTLTGGVRVYDLAAYRSGFLLLIVFALLSALLIGFTAETRCRQALTGEKEKP
jgi:MFS family permease